MKDCRGCSNEEDKNKLLVNHYIGWASSLPHPCTICRRFPKDVSQLPDNYQDKFGGRE